MVPRTVCTAENAQFLMRIRNVVFGQNTEIILGSLTEFLITEMTYVNIPDYSFYTWTYIAYSNT